MGFRLVVIQNKAHLSYSNGYLLVKKEDDIKMIHLSEISMVFIETGMVSITTFLINELVNSKISLIFCDERHNPVGEFIPYYNSFHISKNLKIQCDWALDLKIDLWTKIVRNKISNQRNILLYLKDEKSSNMLREYAEVVELDDVTNREGHAAKVYFNAIFGNEFQRSQKSNINSILDYGYSILLSSMNKAIVTNGYYTQIGIKHKNEYNPYNLACDLMEVFRPIIDKFAIEHINDELTSSLKHEIVDVLNSIVFYNGKKQYVVNAMNDFAINCFNYLNNKNSDYENFCYEI